VNDCMNRTHILSEDLSVTPFQHFFQPLLRHLLPSCSGMEYARATLLNTGTSLFNSLDVGVWEDFIISPIHDSMNMFWSHFCSPAAFHTNHTPTQVFYAPGTCMHTATKRPICTLYSRTSLKGLSESRTQCKKHPY